ncbi:uncharacterized protein SCODWIG_01325 [Saccharomycodes ludwigii]|uniref:PRP1 splicing factor N-terminal domain-containing protein n=1 Tax=Saccharomycodes ludwigii TaxID=36035 RepID=A0A376B513_9ASCO|nr:uncharacterized protein SCODWIG_01325 [Saccharomycodes ludwigii]
MERPKFLDQDPPPGYIAGIGRGATGFTTRSDLGSSALSQTPNRYLENKSLSTDNITEDVYEAEKIFSNIDDELSTRNKQRKNRNQPKIKSTTTKFIDLKQQLTAVSKDEWLNLPEATDMTRRNKRLKLENQQQRNIAMYNPSILSTTNLEQLANDREKLLEQHIDSKFGTILENNDYQELLKNLNTNSNRIDTYDVEKSRKVLQSYIRSDPKNPNGWIALARLEEKCLNFKMAKKIIHQGCNEVVYDEDIWLENIRLNRIDDAPLLLKCKTLVAQALKFNGAKSEKLWIKAIELEQNAGNKNQNTITQIIHKALQINPYSEELWKQAVKYEESKEEAIKVLAKAIEFVPKSVDLWTGYIKLQDFGPQQRKTLANAVKELPSSKEMWALGCQLEERAEKPLEKKEESVKCKIIQILKRFKTPHNNDVGYCESWLKQAEKCDLEKYPITAQCIIECFIPNNFLKELLPKINSVELKNFAFQYLLLKQEHLNDPVIWDAYIVFCESGNDNTSKLAYFFQFCELTINDMDDDISKKSLKILTKYNKQDETLRIIDKKLLNTSEYTLRNELQIMKIGILISLKKYSECKRIFEQMIAAETTATIFLKYIDFLIYLNNYEKALIICQLAMEKHPDEEEFVIKMGTIYEFMSEIDKAKQCYINAVSSNFSHSISLWILSAKHEANINKARLLYDKGILKNTKNSGLLMLEKAKREFENGNLSEYRILLNTALKSYSHMPEIWCQLLRTTKKKNEKRNLFQQALKVTNTNALILLEVAINFWNEQQFEKAYKWADQSCKANKKLGDSWIWLYKCSVKLGRKNTEWIKEKVNEIEPDSGEMWNSRRYKFLYSLPSEKLVSLA